MERTSLKEYSFVFLVKGEKFKLRKLPSKDFIFLSSRVNVHDFEHYGKKNIVLKWEFN